MERAEALLLCREKIEEELLSLRERFNNSRLDRKSVQQYEKEDRHNHHVVSHYNNFNGKKKIQDCEDALGRMAKGLFGICINCNNEILSERLIAFPTAKRCVRCQAVHEKKKKGVLN